MFYHIWSLLYRGSTQKQADSQDTDLRSRVVYQPYELHRSTDQQSWNCFQICHPPVQGISTVVRHALLPFQRALLIRNNRLFCTAFVVLRS